MWVRHYWFDVLLTALAFFPAPGPQNPGDNDQAQQQAQTQGEQGDDELRCTGCEREQENPAGQHQERRPAERRPADLGCHQATESSGRTSAPSRATTWHAAD